MTGDERGMTNKCSVGSWVGSWDRKGALVEKLVKPK